LLDTPNSSLPGLLSQLGCVVCLRLGYGETPAEIHHLRSGAGIAQRSDNSRAIPLCHLHHRNGGYGVAFHAGPREFERLFGTEEELLEYTHNLLETKIKRGEICTK